MDDLVQWLREQLDEDERDAKERRGIFPSPGVNDDGSVCLHVRPGGNMAITWYRHPAEGWDDMAKLRNWADTEHGWTQERVLREIDAKRELLRQYEHLKHEVMPDDLTGVWAFEAVLRVHTVVYADRPGYREEWRP